MSDKLLIPRDSLRDIHKYSQILYKSLSSLLSGYETPDPDWDNRRQLDFLTEPWRYYRIQFGDKYISIHKNRDSTFSLQIAGFTPKFVLPYKAKHGRFRNFFGSFSSWQDALVAFSREIYDLTFELAGIPF